MIDLRKCTVISNVELECRSGRISLWCELLSFFLNKCHHCIMEDELAFTLLWVCLCQSYTSSIVVCQPMQMSFLINILIFEFITSPSSNILASIDKIKLSWKFNTDAASSIYLWMKWDLIVVYFLQHVKTNSFRASIEEKYAKDLLSLSKKVCGHNEMK